jgi:hypothetical protein
MVMPSCGRRSASLYAVVWLMAGVVHFGGVDNHPQRTDGPSTRSPAEGHGTGVQVEGVISYDVTSAFSLGVGGR